MLRWRVISAIVILGAVTVASWLDLRHHFGHPGIWLAPLGLLLTGLATYEVLELLRARQLRPVSWTAYAGTLGLMGAACLPIVWTQEPAAWLVSPGDWILLALVVSVGLAFAGEMLRYQQPGAVIVHVSLVLFTVGYVGVLMTFVAQIRLFGENAVGMGALVSFVVVTKASDVGAYGFGRWLGRHKLVPRLSPGKTVEGAVGGIVAACVASVLMFWLAIPVLTGFPPGCGWGAWLVYGVLLAVAGMFGDLAESLLKRDMDRKDSSHLVPGLGGVLDFLDSLLFAAPVAYASWSFGLVAG